MHSLLMTACAERKCVCSSPLEVVLQPETWQLQESVAADNNNPAHLWVVLQQVSELELRQTVIETGCPCLPGSCP